MTVLTAAFQMEPMSQVNPEKNSTLAIMQEAQKRGHEIYQYGPNEITLSNNRVFARARKIKIDKGKDPFYTAEKDVLIDLLSVDVVFMRQDPPFNMEYITATYMLEAIDRHTLVVNHPVSVRNAPEKIFPFAFGEYMPPTVITEDYNAVHAFLHSEKEIIIKPLYMYGGQDVFYFKDGEDEKLKKQFKKLLDKYQAPIVTQKFIPEVKEGDKRILLIDGEVEGAFLRVPREGSVRANLMAGGKLEKTKLTSHEKEICKKISPVLKQRQFMICGLDVVGDYLTEINVTSPIGFVEIAKLYNENPAASLWYKIEQRLEQEDGQDS